LNLLCMIPGRRGGCPPLKIQLKNDQQLKNEKKRSLTKKKRSTGQSSFIGGKILRLILLGWGPSVRGTASNPTISGFLGFDDYPSKKSQRNMKRRGKDY